MFEAVGLPSSELAAIASSVDAESTSGGTASPYTFPRWQVNTEAASLRGSAATREHCGPRLAPVGAAEPLGEAGAFTGAEPIRQAATIDAIYRKAGMQPRSGPASIQARL